MEPEPILPNPNGQHLEPAMSSQESMPSTGESSPAVPERSQSVMPARQQVAQPAPQAQQQVVTQDNTVQAAQQTSNPPIADDVDVIEKEWVDKAKKIVAVTKDDPHEQEKEVSKLQADYLMKRYGKQIKIVE